MAPGVCSSLVVCCLLFVVRVFVDCCSFGCFAVGVDVRDAAGVRVHVCAGGVVLCCLFVVWHLLFVVCGLLFVV